ncbi:peptide ABC transporter substrate-binding protein [Chloroflexia bacterium SDU3-3]|nr:peptide ABC transporter substrate-binding protein [Chloroflexia bacterium SDU3-3]
MPPSCRLQSGQGLPISKRRTRPMVKKSGSLLSAAALLLCASPLFAACTGAASTPTPPPASGSGTTAVAGATDAAQPSTNTSSEVKDVTVTLPFQQGGITSLDHAFWTSQLFLSQGVIFEGLYGYDKDLKVVPRVAESATPSADNKVWTIKLRQDKKWSNGDPVTAKDYYAAWMRLMGPELKDAPMWAGMWSNIKNANAFKAGAAKPEEVGLKLVDDYTLEITLIQPNAALINLLCISTSMPINANSLKEHPTDWWDPKNGVYNGPYVVQSWVSGGDIALTRNPNYVGDGIGNVKNIMLRPYQDANSRLQAYENNEIQFTFLEDASQLAYAENVPAMKDNMKSVVNDIMWRGIEYNRAVDPGPLADQRVRQAFALAIDKKTITDNVLAGLGTPADAFSSMPEIASKIKPLSYDVAKAKQLLADAGYPNGQGMPELVFDAPPANDPLMPLIEAVVKMWQDNLGVKVTIQNHEGPAYNTLVWSNFNKDIKPGFAVLGGPMNWFQPTDLLLATGHIWWFMDFKKDGTKHFVEFEDKINAVKNLTAAGDWDALQKRADAVWAKRQTIMETEKDNSWGKLMQTPPTFKENFDLITERFKSAADDAAKLSAYQDAETLVLKEEQDTTKYGDLTENNLKAQRLLIALAEKSMDDAYDTVVPLQQMAIDSAWMVPVYSDKLYYTTDPRLSGIVVNKLSWGGIFQYQYLQWNE